MRVQNLFARSSFGHVLDPVGIGKVLVYEVDNLLEVVWVVGDDVPTAGFWFAESVDMGLGHLGNVGHPKHDGSWSVLLMSFDRSELVEFMAEGESTYWL
jgi:hypothetical protein